MGHNVTLNTMIMAYPDLQWVKTNRSVGLVAYGKGYEAGDIQRLIIRNGEDYGFEIYKCPYPFPDFDYDLERWVLGMSIDEAMPYLTKRDRELFITGVRNENNSV